VGICYHLLVNLIKDLESLRVNAVFQRIFEFLPFGDVLAVYVFRLIVIEEGLEGGKDF
jgi:hypothetical protein